MDLFDLGKPDRTQLQHPGRIRHREPCSLCGKREDTVLCICGVHLCGECTEPHFNDDRDLCPALQINPTVWVEWDAILDVYYAVKVDWRT